MKHQKVAYPSSRLATIDVGKIGRKKHHIYGLLEIDITEARGKIKNSIKRGEEISLISWIIKTISDCIGDNPYIHAINYGKKNQILFDEVDISFPMEKEVDGVKVPLAALIRSANKKSIGDICREIKEAGLKTVDGQGDYVLSDEKHSKASALFFHLPGFLRLLVWKILLSNPFNIKKNMGTVIVTNMGMTGRAPGWILPRSIHNLAFGVGAIVKKPWAVKNKVEVRDILHLTILIDHDAVDGAPAARFTDKLVARLQSSWSL